MPRCEPSPSQPCAGSRSRRRDTRHARGPARRPRSRRRSGVSRACSSTRSRQSSAATGSRSPRASARTSPGIGAAAARARARVRVLGARGVPAARRGVAALRRPDAVGRSTLVRGRRRDASPSRGRDPRRDPCARPARLAPLRGNERGRDVELEAGEGDARPPLEPRRPRDRGPAGIPAPLRPARAGDSEGDPRRPRPGRRGAPARARGEGRRRPRSADRVRASSSTGGCAAAPSGSGPSSTRSSPTGYSSASRSTTAARR